MGEPHTQQGEGCPMHGYVKGYLSYMGQAQAGGAETNPCRYAKELPESISIGRAMLRAR
jgi:hypothetical protein